MELKHKCTDKISYHTKERKNKSSSCTEYSGRSFFVHAIRVGDSCFYVDS